MDKRVILAALLSAVLLTSCGKASVKTSEISAVKKDMSRKAETSSEEISAAEESSAPEESSITEESKPEEESSVTETPPTAESKPAAESSAAETSAVEKPEPAEVMIEHISGTGYGFDVDLSKWMDAKEHVSINAAEGTEGIEYIYGWMGDYSSTCVFASNELSTDLSQYDINEVAQHYLENDAPPTGQTLIDHNTVDINGKTWIRREYTIDPTLFGTESRLLQYTGFNGYRELNICFTITETSVESIDSDLRDLLWSVNFE